MSRKVIKTTNAPNPVGPYSQAIICNNMLFISGQIPIDPDNGEVVSKSFSKQCHRVLLNIKNILEAGGSCLNHVLKITIYMKNLKKFEELNEIYSEYFNTSKPARSCVEVRDLPKGVDIEIDAISEICSNLKS